MRVHFLTSALVVAGLAAGCFVPVQEEDLSGQQNGEGSTPSASGAPDAGGSACGAACQTDAGAPADAGGVFDAGTSTPDAGVAIDAGAPDAGQSVPDAGPCQPGTAGCWNQGCTARDASSAPPGGYCAPCAGMCDCAMGPDGYVGGCITTPTGMWCSWACDVYQPVCAGNAKCLEIVPGDDQSGFCVPSDGQGPCS